MTGSKPMIANDDSAYVIKGVSSVEDISATPSNANAESDVRSPSEPKTNRRRCALFLPPGL